MVRWLKGSEAKQGLQIALEEHGITKLGIEPRLPQGKFGGLRNGPFHRVSKSHIDEAGTRAR